MTGDLSPLLPFTMPTKVRFIDGETKKPIDNLPVYFQWGWSAANPGGSGGTGTSHKFKSMTNKRGEVRLPIHWKPIPVLFFPLYMRTFDGITIFHGNPRYWLGPKEMQPSGRWSGGRPWQFFGSELVYEIELPRETLAGWGEHLIGPANIFGRAAWQKGLNELLVTAGSFQNLPGEALVGIESSCWYQADALCEENDREILRRDPTGETPPGRRALYRQGKWTQAAHAIEEEIKDHVHGFIWDMNQGIIKELKLTATCSDLAYQLAKTEGLLEVTREQKKETVNKLVQKARTTRTAGDKKGAVVTWLAMERFLTVDEMAEAGEAAQELGYWRLSERLARTILLRDRNSEAGWELRSKALVRISSSEHVTADPTLASAAEQAAIRAIRLNGKAGAWLALAEVRRLRNDYKGEQEAIQAASNLKSEGKESMHLPKLELPDENQFNR